MFLLSDLDPLQAPHWSVRVRKADNPQCLLGKKPYTYLNDKGDIKREMFAENTRHVDIKLMFDLVRVMGWW